MAQTSSYAWSLEGARLGFEVRKGPRQVVVVYKPDKKAFSRWVLPKTAFAWSWGPSGHIVAELSSKEIDLVDLNRHRALGHLAALPSDLMICSRVDGEGLAPFPVSFSPMPGLQAGLSEHGTWIGHCCTFKRINLGPNGLLAQPELFWSPSGRFFAVQTAGPTDDSGMLGPRASVSAGFYNARSFGQFRLVASWDEDNYTYPTGKLLGWLGERRLLVGRTEAGGILLETYGLNGEEKDLCRIMGDVSEACWHY